MANLIFLTAIIAGTIFLIIKRIRPQQNRGKASEILENFFFPAGNIQKRKVVEAFSKITSQKFSDEEIIDFFLKEKGLQLIYTEQNISKSVVKYIQKPTMIDLNYFERVKFQEVFINYPRGFEVKYVENANTVFNELPLQKVSSIIAKSA